jgi:AraC-like DNA-binding protein/quercetin dioxygenase-like cupin family protein
MSEYRIFDPLNARGFDQSQRSLSIYREELLKRDSHPRVTAYYFKQWVGFRMPYLHAHETVEIMYVMEGSAAVAVSEEQVALRKGELIFIDAEVPHRLWVDADKSCRMLNVEFGFGPTSGASPSFREVVMENPPLAGLLAESRPFFVLKDTGEVLQTLKSLVLELDERGTEPRMMVLLLLAELLIRVARLLHNTLDPARQSVDAHVQRALEFLHHHYDCGIRVKDVAAAVGLHPGYMHRLFTAQVGRTVMDYLTGLRMEKAKMLLTQSDIPVTEIPDYIGVNSRPYFTVLFKKHTGMTPAAYRKTYENRVNAEK